MSSTMATAESIPSGYVRRYTFHERVCHWVTAIAYSYCLLTGLALHLFWIARVLGGGPTSRFWHPIIGVAFFAATLWMHGIWRQDMSVSSVDRAWLNSVKYYATNRDELVPAQERFNAGQKLFYWVMFASAVVLLLSGLVMWFPEYIPFRLNWIHGTAVVNHESAALVSIGAFIIHIYMGVFLLFGYVPAVWPRSTTGFGTTRLLARGPATVDAIRYREGWCGFFWVLY
jgi:formate dehydrogenase subunit gamma